MVSGGSTLDLPLELKVLAGIGIHIINLAGPLSLGPKKMISIDFLSRLILNLIFKSPQMMLEIDFHDDLII